MPGHDRQESRRSQEGLRRRQRIDEAVLRRILTVARRPVVHSHFTPQVSVMVAVAKRRERQRPDMTSDNKTGLPACLPPSTRRLEIVDQRKERSFTRQHIPPSLEKTACDEMI